MDGVLESHVTSASRLTRCHSLKTQRSHLPISISNGGVREGDSGDVLSRACLLPPACPRTGRFLSALRISRRYRNKSRISRLFQKCLSFFLSSRFLREREKDPISFSELALFFKAGVLFRKESLATISAARGPIRTLDSVLRSRRTARMRCTHC